MNTLETIILILLVLNAIALCALVLLQQGKGADIGAAFGSGAASAVFGGAGSASFLAKLTAWLAIGFFLLSFGLAFSAKERAASLKDLGIPTGYRTGRSGADDRARTQLRNRTRRNRTRHRMTKLTAPGQTCRFRRSRCLTGIRFYSAEVVKLVYTLP